MKDLFTPFFVLEIGNGSICACALTLGNTSYNVGAFVDPIRCQMTTSVMVVLVLVWAQEVLQGVITDDLQAPF